MLRCNGARHHKRARRMTRPLSKLSRPACHRARFCVTTWSAISAARGNRSRSFPPSRAGHAPALFILPAGIRSSSRLGPLELARSCSVSDPPALSDRPLELPIGPSSSPLPIGWPDPPARELGRVPRPLRPRSVPVVRDPRAVVREPWFVSRGPRSVALEPRAMGREPRALENSLTYTAPKKGPAS